MASNKPEVQFSSAKPDCHSHATGHQVHWIQARVQRSQPRHDAKVEVLGKTQVRVSWLDQSHIFTHHNTAGIQAALDAGVLDYVKFAPDANLLYIQTEQANESHGGAFSVSYLCPGDLAPCFKHRDAVDVRELDLGDDDE